MVLGSHVLSVQDREQTAWWAVTPSVVETAHTCSGTQRTVSLPMTLSPPQLQNKYSLKVSMNVELTPMAYKLQVFYFSTCSM